MWKKDFYIIQRGMKVYERLFDLLAIAVLAFDASIVNHYPKRLNFSWLISTSGNAITGGHPQVGKGRACHKEKPTTVVTFTAED
jgi:hypothetical protein